MIKYPIWLAVFLLVIACNQKPQETTSLDDKKIAQIMADMSVALAATNGLSGYAKDSLAQVYYKQLFQIHGTTPEVYEHDLRVVGADLSRLQTIVKESIKLLEPPKAQ